MTQRDATAGLTPTIGLGVAAGGEAALQGGSAAAAGIENIIDLNPYVAVVMFVLDILEWTGVIPDPIQLLASLFMGRPKQEATVEIIKRLTTSPNAAARLYAIELSRLLKDDGIVISDSSAAGQALLGKAAHQFVQNLQNQGVSLKRARLILADATSTAAQSGLALEPELKIPVPQDFTAQGPDTLKTLYQQGYQHGQELQINPKKLPQFAERYEYQHARLKDLFQISIQKPPPQPPQSPGCPPGQHWDPSTEQCVPDLPPPPIPPFTPQPGGDEFTDCCQQTQANLQAIQSAVQNLGQQLGQQTPTSDASQCCDELVAAITAVSQAIDNPAAAVPGAGGTGAGGAGSAPPPDLSPIVEALCQLVVDMATLPPLAATATAALDKYLEDDCCAALGRIADDWDRWVAGIPTPVEIASAIQLLYRQLAQAGLPNAGILQQLSS